MTPDPYVYESAPEIAILDILDATLEVASQAMNGANPAIQSQAPYWIKPTLGPAYEIEDRIADLQAAIGQYRSMVIKLLPPDPDLEDVEPDPAEAGESQLQLPF